MAKRKVKDIDGEDVPVDGPRRSSRRAKIYPEESRPVKAQAKAKTGPAKKARKVIEEARGKGDSDDKEHEQTRPEPKTAPKVAGPRPANPPATPQYWLMKAEPESRLENGHDVKFSIDDLAAKTEPEPWDGIRAYPARNNLRAMKKGDLAFFYHSSCKVPAIVGIMEIVKEHEPDLSAHVPSAPYHDPSSSPDNPKWSLVHVSFRQKLTTPITLKDLRAFQEKKGSPLKEMQMLKQTRLSVSRVSEEEWRFLMEKMKEKEDVMVD